MLIGYEIFNDMKEWWLDKVAALLCFGRSFPQGHLVPFTRRLRLFS